MKLIVILGKSGSGKGTQAELLHKNFGFEYFSVGKALRKRAAIQDFIGIKIRKVLKEGGLIPTPLVFHFWFNALERFRKKKVKKLIIEGSPRKLYEAWMLQELVEFYGWDKDFLALHLKISDKEALKRLLKRGRSDDEIQAIKNRLKWFRQEVMPVIDFYRKKNRILEINGEGKVEDIHKRIVRKLKHFLK